MTERSYRWLFWCLALFGLALDQTGKYGVFHWMYHDGIGGLREVVPGVFRLRTDFQMAGEMPATDDWRAHLRTLGGDSPPRVNHGALWGLGGDVEGYERLANRVFAGVSIAAAVAIVLWSTRRTMVRDWRLCAALGLILAGTLGNLYDRVVFDGVRDYLEFYWFRFPVFNVADCCLVCGAFLLLAQAFFSPPHAGAAPATESIAMSSETAEARSA